MLYCNCNQAKELIDEPLRRFYMSTIYETLKDLDENFEGVGPLSYVALGCAR